MKCPRCGADVGLPPVRCPNPDCNARIMPCPTCKGDGCIVTGTNR